MMRYLFILVICSFSYLADAQYTISGKVFTGHGEPLEFASVFLKNTDYGAVTDKKGLYILKNIPSGTYILKVSFVGYTDFHQEITLDGDLDLDINLGLNKNLLTCIVVPANRVDNNGAFAFKNLDKEDLNPHNQGQDVPYLLRWTPSAVVTSDAGTGIGYTGIRLRGTDPTGINVTINNVPLNDAESQGVFWVDLPDFASTVHNIQIQRGVGSSAMGTGSYGGAISLSTGNTRQNAYADINTTYGSFDTKKLSVSLGTGLLNDIFSIDARYSIIRSDGYIDRAASDLKSYYFSAARIGEKSSLRFLTFSGKERTYQSWWGTPESVVNGDDEEILAHYQRNAWFYDTQDSINLFSSGRTYNYYTYQNQVDDYGQDHYQLHYNLSPAPNSKITATAFYVKGRGFYEEYKKNENLAFYGITDQKDMDGHPVESSDLVRQRWLDNDFYGMILNTDFDFNNKLKLKAGAGVSQYAGDHFGKVIHVAQISNPLPDKHYYDGKGLKDEANVYAKATYNQGKLSSSAEIQWRGISYDISGEDDDHTPLDISKKYSFVNPKIGVNYPISEHMDVYMSYAIANREPKRKDLIENRGNKITHETLYDVEAGYRWHTDRVDLEWNNYLMRYNNQLVLTGQIDNSGAYIKTNVGKSFRLGTEFSVAHQLTPQFSWNTNVTISKNKIKKYVEDLGLEMPIIHQNTDIAFSPNIILGGGLQYHPVKNLDLFFMTKYVGRQYLDNTSNENRKLPSYTYSDLKATYEINIRRVGRVEIIATIHNLFDALYSSNGYTYSYALSEQDIVTENFLYPQAGRHFMLSVNLGF